MLQSIMEEDESDPNGMETSFATANPMIRDNLEKRRAEQIKISKGLHASRVSDPLVGTMLSREGAHNLMLMQNYENRVKAELMLSQRLD